MSETTNRRKRIEQRRRKARRRNSIMRKRRILAVAITVICLAVVAGIFLFFQSKKGEKVKTEPSAMEKTEQKASKTDKDSGKKDKEALVVWTTDRIRLRDEPSSEGEVITVIASSTELTVLDETDGWLQVEYDGQKGYVSKEYTTDEKPEKDAKEGAKRPSQKTGGHVVCIDPGHQRNGDSTQEPNGPGSGNMKARVSGGTAGRTTGIPEYQLNLAIALQLQKELEARGYTVYLTRTSHDVNISNKERAEYATSVGADITVRLHANGSDNTGVSGALALTPSSGNPYVSHLASASQSLSSCVLNAYCTATGMINQGVQASDTMTGINWCTTPVTILEMGYMTNPNDDVNMQDPEYQSNMVIGIANGIDQYFGY